HMKGHKTSCPGVCYRQVARIGGSGLERVYYIIFKKAGKVFEERVGRQDGYRFVNYLQANFGAKEPKQISQMDAHRLRLNLSKNLAPQTVKHILVLLQRIILFGVNRGLCQGLAFNTKEQSNDYYLSF
ncbi:MAG: hypothetical protein Q8L00_01005, partial [Deltaproteobacteria bacterium]|nr:hypothetical protein [Deltaproteobacteria bacterium]